MAVDQEWQTYYRELNKFVNLSRKWLNRFERLLQEDDLNKDELRAILFHLRYYNDLAKDITRGDRVSTDKPEPEEIPEPADDKQT